MGTPPERHLGGKVAIVTGAGRGIGQATAQALASAGADVLVNDPGGAIDGGGADSRIAQKSGAIINMSSGVSLLGAIANAGYCAAKAGVLGLSAAAAMDLGPFGIRVNSLFPAASSRLDTKEEPWRKVYRTADRPVMPADVWRPEIVATFVTYLASDRAADINGQLFACGGESIGAFPVWQADTTLSTPGGDWTLDSLAESVPKLLANKVNPSPRQAEPFVWPWIRPGGLSAAHESLERR